MYMFGKVYITLTADYPKVNNAALFKAPTKTCVRHAGALTV